MTLDQIFMRITKAGCLRKTPGGIRSDRVIPAALAGKKDAKGADGVKRVFRGKSKCREMMEKAKAKRGS